MVIICSDIRKTFEDLIQKWSSVLSKEELSTLDSLPENHDGIDNILQSLNAIQCKFKKPVEFIYADSIFLFQ